MQIIKIAISCISLFLTINSSAQLTTQPDPNKKLQVVEASCGMCQLGLKGKDCALAVRISGKAYYVDGASIDSFGDAHAKDGFCNAINKAEVQGEIVNNRFKATYFHLLPVAANIPAKAGKKKG